MCMKIDSDNWTVPKIPSRSGNKSVSRTQESNSIGDAGENPRIEPRMLQNGVLRTNCIDCIDRTNVAQYAYGLVALGRQLHSIGLLGSPEIDLDNPLAEDLMGLYETMGDILAMQYGGSAAHNKVIIHTPVISCGICNSSTDKHVHYFTLFDYHVHDLSISMLLLMFLISRRDVETLSLSSNSS